MVGTPERIYGIGIDPSDQANNKMVPITDLGDSADIEHDDTTGFIYWVESVVSFLYLHLKQLQSNMVVHMFGTNCCRLDVNLKRRNKPLYFLQCNVIIFC